MRHDFDYRCGTRTAWHPRRHTRYAPSNAMSQLKTHWHRRRISPSAISIPRTIIFFISSGESTTSASTNAQTPYGRRDDIEVVAFCCCQASKDPFCFFTIFTRIDVHRRLFFDHTGLGPRRNFNQSKLDLAAYHYLHTHAPRPFH